MKKLLLIALCMTSGWAACTSTYALPTYEPFTEFAPTIAANPITLVATTNANGGDLGTLANSSIPNCINLATGGYSAPGGEQWGSLNFSGTAGTGLYKGLDIAVISNATLFTESALSSLLPSTFPGYPASGGAITNLAENPAQPLIWNGTAYVVNPNIVGNSAVLKFAQPITRPVSGTRTLYVSYLLSVAQQGQLGAGNNGRYLGFLSQSNLVEGVGSGGTYTNWAAMFNTYNATPSVRCPSHGLLLKAANSSYYIGACDSTAGRNWTSTPLSASYGTPIFVVGAYLLNSGANKDTNAVWVNPSLSSFGGANPPASSIHLYTMGFNMSDIGGLVLIDRAGSGALGGVGTNYVANLLVGTTWSYVTGGPEFTSQPASLLAGIGDTASLSGPAVAAGQTVSYQWQKITGNTTNNVSDGGGGAGGAAVVAGATGPSLTLSGISAGDLGTYQVVATASSTGFTLTSSQAQLANIILTSSQPQPMTVNYSSNAAFTASVATTNATMSYAWYKGATPLVDGPQAGGSTVSGAQGTTADSSLTTTLALSNVSYLDDASYTLYVTNNANNALFSTTPATLTVNDPFIVAQPPNTLTVPLGGSTAITLVVAGSGPLSYQWYGQSQGQLSDDGSIHGSTTNTLSIVNAQYANADNYYAIITGPGGPGQSSSTALFVNNPALGPFNTNNWPTSIADNSIVDYVIWDANLSATVQTPATWSNVLTLPASSSDQTWTTRTLNGMTGRQATGSYFNFADPNWKRFVNIPQIDILLLINGDSTMYDSTNGGLFIQYSYGQVPTTTTYVGGGRFPLGANNGQWNWMLLSVTNLVDQFGYLTVGDTSFGGTATYGGINGGTIRLGTTGTAWPAGAGPTIAAAALGPHGAFGTSNQLNRFWAPVNCSPQPAANLAYIDFNQGLTNHLTVVNDPGLGETYQVVTGVGPAGDLRTAIQSTSGFMEFPILDNYLGFPCNENLVMQLCLEVYDDPGLAGTMFGPYQYATDSQGDLATYTGQYYTFTGSGQWLKIAFYVGPANLQGVNTAPLTGGPTLFSPYAQPSISRVELGVIRTGTNALAGQIPDPNYFLAPLVTCSTNYGYYAEWYPSRGILNNVDVPASYSTVSGVGPVSDQRITEQPIPAGQIGYYYEQFALLNTVFGPSYQDNSDVIISVDYYDDPALTNSILYPNTYNTLNNGISSVISPPSPYGTPVVLTGTGQWKTATWELPNVNFTGAYVCRFASTAPIYLSRARFNVIRPCGPFLGIDYLQSLGMANANPAIQLNWRGTATLQAAPVVSGAYAGITSVTNTITNTYTVPMTNSAGFFRLEFPGYPSYLSPYGP